MITTPGAVTPGTTIAEFGSGTVTLAQLRQALGVIPSKPNTQGGGGAGSATIVVGQGLTGGGPVLGNIPINLTVPIPWLMGDDGGGDGDPGPPGISGAQGPQGPTGSSGGPVGPAGPAIFLAAEDGVDGTDGVPGLVGPQGLTGTTGFPGIAIFLAAEDGQDGMDAVPGPPGIGGATGPAGPAIYLLADDGNDGEPGPPGVSATGGGGGIAVHFGSGAPSTLFNNGDLYFDTSALPYQGYVQNVSVLVPSIEGTPINSIWSASTTSAAVAISTTLSNLMVVVVYHEKSATVNSVTSVTAAGLTFTQQFSSQSSGTTNNYQEVWTAPLSGAYSGTIQVTLAVATDDAGFMAWGIQNANTSTIFDTAGGLPATGSSTTGQVPLTVAPAVGDLLMFLQNHATGSGLPGTPTPTTGITLATSVSNTGAVLFQYGTVHTKIESSGTFTSAGLPTSGSGIFSILGFLSGSSGPHWSPFI
jgi:hypothetical protein